MESLAVSFCYQGVGNTLKRHYETYLLEYELAHDDVDGECCLLCHRSLSVSLSNTYLIWSLPNYVLFTIVFLSCWLNSSAAGDWVNCGICGEWAHFGCDRRQGLGAFKVLRNFDSCVNACLTYWINNCMVSKSPSKKKFPSDFSKSLAI